MNALKLAILAIWIFTFTSHANGQAGNSLSNVEAEVETAFQKLVEASTSLNLEQYFSFFDTENFTSLNGDGTVYTSFGAFEEHTAPALSYIKKYQSLEFSNVKITALNNDTAVLVNEYAATVTLKSDQTVSAAGAGTQVWSKKTGEWKLVHVSSSSKPQNLLN